MRWIRNRNLFSIGWPVYQSPAFEFSSFLPQNIPFHSMDVAVDGTSIRLIKTYGCYNGPAALVFRIGMTTLVNVC